MSYKPSDFFIGVIDFFAVLLPGVLLTFFMQAHWYEIFFGDEKMFPALHTDIEKSLGFIVLSYILGNIVFLISSVLLNSFVYERFLRTPFFKTNADLLYHTATEIKEKYLHSSLLINNLLMQDKLSEDEKKQLASKTKKEVVNTFKWIQHFMLLKQPEALILIKKTEADSKFFRCLVIVLLFIAIVSFANAHIVVGFIFLLLSLLSIYRFGILRYKSTQRAYEFLVTYYYINNRAEENSAIANTNKLKENIDQLKTAPTQAFEDEIPLNHRSLIKHLNKGLNKEAKQLIIPVGETTPASFTSKKDEVWYCLHGKGILQFDNSDSHQLIPNATISIAKNKTYSFINKAQEPLELIALKN
jgi:mannose-6-phosphate isomerase-like protein (cupin superfamily)